MIPQPSLGSASFDPNTLRALEQLTNVITDVEQRLQVVRLTLAQSFPGVLPRGVTPSTPGLGISPVNPYFAGVPFASHMGVGALPWANQVPTNPYGAFGLGSPYLSPFTQGVGSPYGNPGVSAPWFPSGIQAPFAPFRY